MPRLPHVPLCLMLTILYNIFILLYHEILYH
nr:MAG TPA: hypothetical protein [Caudoviricetes sp.]